MRRLMQLLIVGSAGAIAISCTSTVTLRNDELHRLMNQPRIQAAILSTGDRIQFDELGGELDRDRRTVTGTTINGDSVALPYGNVYYLRVPSGDSSEGAMRDLDPMALEPEFIPREEGPIAKTILVHGDTIVYDHNGATADFRLMTINGRSHGGNFVSCNLDDVEAVRLKARFDTAKTLLLHGGMLVIAYFYTLSQIAVP